MSSINLCDRVNAVFSKTLIFKLITALSLWTNYAYADEVFLNDGSQLMGTIQSMSDVNLVMDTSFAKDLVINTKTIKGITADHKLMVTLESGDRLKGVLLYSEDKGQRLTQTTFGDIDLQGKSAIANIWRTEKTNPDVITNSEEHKQKIAVIEKQHVAEINEVRKQYEDKLNEVTVAKAKLEDPWSGNIGLGVSGQSGNTDTFSVQGRGEALRDTGFDRIQLYVEGNLEKQNKIASANEVFAGVSLEHDLTPKWFVFGSADFEKDKFENLELRGVAQTGLGRFFIRSDNLTLKGLVGVGYQHESFTDGNTTEEGVVSLGYDFLYKHNDWWKFGHKFTFYPSLSRPASDYRFISNAFTELPLAGINSPWKIRLSLRNQYNSMPRPSITKLDTAYMMNLVYDWQ